MVTQWLLVVGPLARQCDAVRSTGRSELVSRSACCAVRAVGQRVAAHISVVATSHRGFCIYILHPPHSSCQTRAPCTKQESAGSVLPACMLLAVCSDPAHCSLIMHHKCNPFSLLALQLHRTSIIYLMFRGPQGITCNCLCINKLGSSLLPFFPHLPFP